MEPSAGAPLLSAPALHAAAVAAGGAAGALCRAWVSARAGATALEGPLGPALAGLPLGALWVNWAGSFALGALVALLPTHTPLRAALTTGFMGALTTFSTLSVEVVTLARAGRPLAAGAHLALHGAGGLIFALLGLSLGALFAREGR